MDRPRVEDAGHFFSDDAIAKANDTIAQIKRDSGKDLYIESYPAIPADRKASYNPSSAGNSSVPWRMSAARPGCGWIVVLICRDPGFVQVRVGKQTIRQAFIQKNVDELQTTLTSAFKSNQFDQGLQQAVEYVRDTLAQSLPKRSAAPAPNNSSSSAPRERSSSPPVSPGMTGPTARSNSPGIGTWLCVGIGAIIVVALIARAIGGRAAIQNR